MAVPLAQFVKHLADSGLMSPEEIRSVEESVPADKLSPDDAQGFARELIRQRRLTRYQATAVYQGKAQDLVLGKYVVLDELGKGGMGQVFKAEHRRMKRVVALKVMSPAAMKSPDAVKRFQREVQAAAKLTHPNIVAAFDADHAHGVHFLVMECVEGSDLATLVKKTGPLSVERAVECIAQAARGLEHAHAQGVVHRDIKPANLLLDRQGTVKILDMGLARIDESLSGSAATGAGLTQSGSIMGTVDYMSPEQALNTKYADRRADIYSLGCSLHYLVTGRSVFSGETLMEKLLAHREQPIPSLAAGNLEFPAQLDDVFAKMIAKNPEDRYQTMGDVLRHLQGIASGTPVASASIVEGAAEEDVAIREFLAAISPAASATELRTRVEPAASETLVSQASANTQTSLLQSAAGRISRLSGRKKLIAAGSGLAIIILALIFILSSDKKPASEPHTTAIAAAREPLGAQLKESRKKDSPPAAVAPFNGNQAKKLQRDWAAHLGVPVEELNFARMRMRLIPPGEYQMGTSETDVEELAKKEGEAVRLPPEMLQTEAPAHPVRITRPFRIAVTEVTVGQFRRFVEDQKYVVEPERSGTGSWSTLNNSIQPEISWRTPDFSQTDEHPVVAVTWNDAQAFCDWLTIKEGARYRLPTEAEWEFVCRAGTETIWPTEKASSGVGDAAWDIENSGKATHPVAGKTPNAFGVFDMQGNAWEWCADYYDAGFYRQSSVDDPVNMTAGGAYVLRGGSFFDMPVMVRAAFRFQRPGSTSVTNFGFRVVRELVHL
jgi:serine/threonine-protein kinase